MVQNDLDEETIYEKGASIDFPDSVIEFAQGYIGQPYQGFPEKLQKLILKDREPIMVRPGELLEDVDFKEMRDALYNELNRPVNSHDLISNALYPKVFKDYQDFLNTYGDMSVLDTPTFFYGMKLGEVIEVEIEKGKTLIVKLVTISEPKEDGTRVVYFELNGQSREITIRDNNIESAIAANPKADKSNPNHVGATMPGTVLEIHCAKGDTVKKRTASNDK